MCAAGECVDVVGGLYSAESFHCALSSRFDRLWNRAREESMQRENVPNKNKGTESNSKRRQQQETYMNNPLEICLCWNIEPKLIRYFDFERKTEEEGEQKKN